MKSINFDTLEYLEVLKKSGMKEEQAEALTKATSKAFTQMIESSDVATHSDLINLKIELQSFIVKTISTAIVILGGWQTIFSYYNS